MAPESSAGETSQAARRWQKLLPAFFAAWTLLIGVALWWFQRYSDLDPGHVITYENTGKPFWLRFREWFTLARLNFHWAFGWVAFGPYVLWLASRYHLERGAMLRRSALLILVGIGFVVGCGALNNLFGMGKDVLVVIGRTMTYDSREPGGLTNRSKTFREETFTSLIVRSNGVQAPIPGFRASLGNDGQPMEMKALLEDLGLPTGSNAFGHARNLHVQHNAPASRPALMTVLDVLAFVALAGLAHTFHFYRGYHERERQAAMLSARLNETRLRAIRNQLQPHFLFNALNGIATLVRRDPETGYEMLTSLSDLLRLALRRMDAQEIPLREEMEFVERYVQIQQMRFGDRLRVIKDVPQEYEDSLVPTLIVQTLVENAIKHGVEPSSRRATVEIRARADGENLTLSVEDDGMGLQHGTETSSNGEGVGLRSLKERLAALYGSACTFALVAREPRGVLVRVTLPLRGALALAAIPPRENPVT